MAATTAAALVAATTAADSAAMAEPFIRSAAIRCTRQAQSAWRGGLSAGTFAGHGAGINAGAWRHAQNWGNWGHGEGWGRDFGHHGFYGFGYGYPGWYGWYGGWGWPYYGYGLGYWPYYGYGDYGYEPSYYADGGYGSTVSYATPSESYETPSESTVEGTSIEPGQEYFAQAREFFQIGNYQNALRLAGHAAVEAPRNPEVHELASLALFALKDYRGAAMEAHAALRLARRSIGPRCTRIMRTWTRIPVSSGRWKSMSVTTPSHRRATSCWAIISS